MRMVLFDIDGTLISYQSIEAAVQGCFKRAISEVAGIDVVLDSEKLQGMVDPQIIVQVMTSAGLGRDIAVGLLPGVIERIEKAFPAIKKQPMPNRGVKELLRVLKSSSNHRLGVMTGNLRAEAEDKLSRAELWTFFDETFCGNGYFDRDALAVDAVEACLKKYELLGGEQVTLIGDTPRDVKAAKTAGALSIGVASGRFTTGELLNAGADFAVSSLVPCNGLLGALEFR